MASKVYHGICREVEEGQYKVIVSDIDLIEDDFQFKDGDLLSVYFLQANESDSPTLAIYVGDTEEEPSTIDDSGKSVKNRSVLFESSGAWEAGETVLFCYTKNYNQDNVYYWEIIEGGRATEDIYGVTKLEGNSSTPIGEWIITEDEDDWTTALTPGMLKKLYQALIGGEERGDEEEDPEAPDQIAPLLGLTWTSAVEGDKTTLGTLSLNSSTGVEIDYPLRQAVIDIISSQESEDPEEPPLIVLPERTSDLINDGPDPYKENNRDNGTYYITNVLNGISMYYPSGNGTFEFMIPNSGNNTVILKNNLSVPNNIRGGSLTSTGSINGVTITASGQLSGNTINATNNIAGATISARGNVISANAIKEQGSWLKDKYSGKLRVFTKSYNNISIGKNGHISHYKINVAQSGYTPIGIVGYNLNYHNPKSTGDATWCSVWECHFINSTQIEFGLHNHKSSSVKVDMVVYILYEKNN